MCVCVWVCVFVYFCISVCICGITVVGILYVLYIYLCIKCIFHVILRFDLMRVCVIMMSTVWMGTASAFIFYIVALLLYNTQASHSL